MAASKRGARGSGAADLLIYARRVYRTAFDRRPCGAVAVKGGQVVALGSRRQLGALRGRGTRIVDVGDGAVTAGLVDSHTHFFYWALNRRLVIDVTGLPTLEATLEKVRSESRARRVGDWVVARGFDYNLWSGREPTAADLDRAVSNAPAMVRSRDGHTAWLNTRGLKKHAAALKHDEAGGRIIRDGRGCPTGIVQEATIDKLINPVVEFAWRDDARSLATVDAALAEAYDIAWRLGITGVHCMDDSASLNHFQRQRVQQTLGVRVTHSIPHADMDCAIDAGMCSGLGNDWLRIAAVKFFSDGALGSQTAYMFDSYPGRGRYCGVPNVIGKKLRDDVVRCARHGLAVWIHAIGDRAASESIDAIIAARKVETEPLPHRIEHAQCVRPADIRRMAKWKIAASVQPCHLLGDVDNADKHWPRARKNAYPLRGMLDAGVCLAAGSDVPIESIDPRRSFFAATMRTKDDGEPRGGWFPSEKITARETLHAFTRGAAESVGEPLPNGTIAVGGPADLTLWRDDPIQAPPEKLREICFAGCVINGHVRGGGTL